MVLIQSLVLEPAKDLVLLLSLDGSKCHKIQSSLCTHRKVAFNMLAYSTFQLKVIFKV